ncbi:hypothetical protein PG994_007347 [Apiospora phragmitis]|uniref:Cytochrome P450 n=1 Tax=Apiospora phragmitis TaxID=2905665 RepID=A0ABR1V0J6_9PEZI
MTLYALSCSALTVLLSIVVGRVIYALSLSPYRNVPGPRLCKITRWWAVYHDMWLRRIDKIHEWHREYGDVVLVAPGEVSFANAALMKEVYGSNRRHPKSKYFDNFLMYGERPIFCTLDVREHRQVLKRTFAFYQPNSIYKPTTLQPLLANARKLMNQLEEAIEANRTVDVLLYSNFYSFDNATRLMYGPELCANTIEDADCEERAILEGWKEVEAWNNLSYNFPWVHRLVRSVVSYATENPAFLTAEEQLTDWNIKKVNCAMQNSDKMVAGSLLHQLSNAKTPDTGSLPVTWVAAEILDNIHAAQTTVSLAITFLLWSLACHPGWQDELRTELLALPVHENGEASFEDIRCAPILDACVRESSRINPLSSGRAERVVPATKAYNDVVLPGGTIVSASTKSIHHRPDVFPDPYAFRPERWLGADDASLRAMEAWHMPFGYGARLCLGKAFALAEIKLLIACIVTVYELRNDPASGTTEWTMQQLGTQNSMPRGQRCHLRFRRLPECKHKRAGEKNKA